MGRIHADLFAFLKRHPVGRLLIPCICPSQFCPAQLETYLAAKFCMQQATQGLKKQDKDNNHQIINFALLLLETDLVNYACKIVSIVVGTVDVCICEAFRLKVLATTGCCLHTDEGTEAFIRLQVSNFSGKQRTLPRQLKRYPKVWGLDLFQKHQDPVSHDFLSWSQAASFRADSKVLKQEPWRVPGMKRCRLLTKGWPLRHSNLGWT